MAGNENNQVHGNGKTLADAVQDAWDKAPKRGGEETTYEVATITVHGNNPLSGYSVVLTPIG